MTRKIFATILGIVAAGAIVAVVEALGHTIYPAPPDLDMNDPVQFRNYVQGLPIGALLAVLAAWLLATLGGGLLACFIVKEKPFVYATIVGAFVLAATVANLILLPHPLWFSATAVVTIAAVTYLTGIIASSQVIAGSRN